jgi:VWFA-related protein
MRARSRRLTLSIVACASMAAGPYGHTSATAQSRTPSPSQGRTNTVFVTVTEGSGGPVLDLAPADFVIKEDGKNREVVRAEIANVPMHVLLLVDDNGTGIFRFGIAQFIQQLAGRAQIAISTVTGQTQTLVDYTTDMTALSTVVNTLTARPATNDGGQLLEGIFQGAKDQARRGFVCPIMIALTVGGEEHSTVPAHYVLDELAKSGSRLYVVQVASNAQMRPNVAITQPKQLLTENLNLSEVLGEGPKQSGGQRIEMVAAPGLVHGLQRIAVELKSQYAVAYSRPDGRPRATERLNVSVKRRGVTLRAPSRVPGRDGR